MTIPILFILGLFCGILLSTLALAALLYFKTPIERTLKRAENISSRVNGRVLEEPNPELNKWLNELPKKP